MFIYFNEKKCIYHKGQLAPFFIAFIVILLIAALVTINIGKIGKTKTFSANATDAGALAAGSQMATAFNYIAVSNSYMITNYQWFFAAATISFIIAEASIIYAMVQTKLALAEACVFPCNAWFKVNDALGAIDQFIQSIASLIIQVTAFWMNQLRLYVEIYDNVFEIYDSALSLGYKFAFYNSGIAPKLTDEQQDVYREWQKNQLEVDILVGNNAIVNYNWLDGQGRQHDVATKVSIDEPDTYELRHTILPFPAEILFLSLALYYGDIAETNLLGALGALSVACPCWGCKDNPWTGWFCKPCFEAACEAAKTFLILAFPAELKASIATLFAWTGINVNGTVIDSNGGYVGPAALHIICWIDDIKHDRLVDVYQTQRHQGAESGLWETRYPLVTSSTQVNFESDGQIYKPKAEFDPSIVDTDYHREHLLEPLEGTIDIDAILEEETNQ